MLMKRSGSSSTISDKSDHHARAKSRMFSISSRADSYEGVHGRQSVGFEENEMNGHVPYPNQERDSRRHKKGDLKKGATSSSSGTATARYSDYTEPADDSSFPLEPEPKSVALTFNESHSTLQSITDSLVRRAPGGKIDRLPRNTASAQQDQQQRPRTSRTRRKTADLNPTASSHAKDYSIADSEFLANYDIEGGGPSPVDSTYLEQRIADYDEGIIGVLSETSSESSSRPPVPISSPVHYPNAKGYPSADTPASAAAKIAAASAKSPGKRPGSAKTAKLRAHCSNRSGKCSCSVRIYETFKIEEKTSIA